MPVQCKFLIILSIFTHEKIEEENKAALVIFSSYL